MWPKNCLLELSQSIIKLLPRMYIKLDSIRKNSFVAEKFQWFTIYPNENIVEKRQFIFWIARYVFVVATSESSRISSLDIIECKSWCVFSEISISRGYVHPGLLHNSRKHGVNTLNRHMHYFHYVRGLSICQNDCFQKLSTSSFVKF